MPKSDYDKVAPYYDSLSRLVYGDAILKANSYLADQVPPGSTVLIVGGGTGHILEQIAVKHASGISIVYVDISEKMIDRARKRFMANNKVIFICHPIEMYVLENYFDVIITPFLFDNFSFDSAKKIFLKINDRLKARGHWLFADFQVAQGMWWQQWLLRIMYFFFRLTCKIEASDLPDMSGLFDSSGYELIRSRNFFKGFISSIIYQKQL